MGQPRGAAGLIRWRYVSTGATKRYPRRASVSTNRGLLACVAKGFSDAIDCGVHAVVVVDKSSVGPQCAGDFFARQKFAGLVQQHQQNLEGLRVELDADSLPAKLPCRGVCLEILRSDNAGLARNPSSLLASLPDCAFHSPCGGDKQVCRKFFSRKRVAP